MSNQELNRRDFHKLSMAALGGALAGSIAGCAKEEAPAPKPTPAAKESAKGDTETTTVADAAPSNPNEGPTLSPPANAVAEFHLCRGLNVCKGQGADMKNECAGQGTCATASTHHDCGGKNACKGQGGCGEDVARNTCKGEGGCHVPLMDSAWKTARKRFEAALDKQGKKVGAAPPKKA